MKELAETLKETLERVSEFRNDYLFNEQAVRAQLIEPILNSLGWKTSNPKFVRPNAKDEDGKIPDYSLLKDGKTILIVEAKNLSADLVEKRIIDQLANYCFKSGIDFGILTNGVKWLLFKTFERNPNDRIIWQVDLKNDKIDKVTRNLTKLSYSNVDTLDVLLKESKLLETEWENLKISVESIVEIVASKLLSRIKTIEPSFNIENSDLFEYVKGKIFELYSEIEDESSFINAEIINVKPEIKDVEDNIYIRHQKSINREKVRVVFPDQTIIKDQKVANTFVESIRKIGPERIQPLNIRNAGYPLISEIRHPKYNTRQIGKFWIMLQTDTPTKVRTLKEISDSLNLGLKIDTYFDQGGQIT